MSSEPYVGTLEPAPPAAQPSGHSAFLIHHSAFLCALVGMALYAVTLGGSWVYDDVYHLFNDDRTQVPVALPGQPPPEYDRPAIEDPRQWGRYITESYNDGVDNLHRPVTSLSFALQATIHGRSEGVAWLWHLFNVVLYGIVCAQVALLAGRLAQTDAEQDRPAAARSAAWVSLCAGLLFAAHPVHVEAVAGIVGRAELICAAGFLGGLLVLTRPLTPLRIVAFVALMLLAIGGKEQGLVLPAVALVWFLSRRWAGLPSLTQRRWPASDVRSAEILDEADSQSLPYEPRAAKGGPADLGKVLLIAIALPLAGYLIAREQWLGLSMAWPTNLLDPTIQPMRDTTGADRWLMPVALAGRYLHLLLWPGTLSIDYGSVVIQPPQRLDDPYLWLGFLAIALFIAALVHALRARWTAGLTALGGFAVTYGVVSNLPTIIGTIFAERLMFLPSAFFVIYVVLLAQRLLVRKPARNAGQVGEFDNAPDLGRVATRLWRARVLIALTVVLAMLGAVRTVTYAVRWNDRVEFYAYQSRVQPQSVRIWMLLAEELRQRTRLEEAAAAAERATALLPDYWSHWILRARIAANRGRLEEALEYAERAVAARTDGNTTAVRAEIEGLIRQRGMMNEE